MTPIHKDKQVNNTGVEEKNSVSENNSRNLPHAGDLNTHAYTENIDIIRLSGNRTSNKHEYSSKTQKGETTVTTRCRRRMRKPDRLCYSEDTDTH